MFPPDTRQGYVENTGIHPCGQARISRRSNCPGPEELRGPVCLIQIATLVLAVLVAGTTAHTLTAERLSLLQDLQRTQPGRTAGGEVCRRG